MSDFENENLQNGCYQNTNYQNTYYQNTGYQNNGFENGNYTYENPGNPYQPQNSVLVESKRENVVAGLVGAFLLSLLGGGLYFLIYQLGFITGFCGLVILVLANFGYEKFSGCKGSKKGIVISMIMLLAITILAEYCCLVYEIYNFWKDDFGVTFFETFRAVPEFMTFSEILGAMIKDIAISLALGLVAAFSGYSK